MSFSLIRYAAIAVAGVRKNSDIQCVKCVNTYAIYIPVGLNDILSKW